MIDMEASAQEIVFRDLSQLMDDYPVFRSDDSGWAERLDVVSQYVKAIGQNHLSEVDQERAYTAFAIQRIVFGISFTQHKLKTAASLGGLKRLVERRAHYFELARYLADHSRFAPSRQICSFLVPLADM